MTGPWIAERDAYQSFTELLAHAERCRALFESANIALPEPLKRLLGMIEPYGRGVQRAFIPAPERTSPPNATPDWISIDLKEAIATTLVLAVLRASHPAPVRAKDVALRVSELNPKVSLGTVANVGTRLSGKQIRRVDGDWSLIHPEQAPVVYNGRLWGPPNVFDKYEVADHRREAVIHLLGHFAGGLQVVQMVEQLQNLPWVRATVNKDLLKEDLKMLAERRMVRRRGNTRKWELVPEREREAHAHRRKERKTNDEKGNGPVRQSHDPTGRGAI